MHESCANEGPAGILFFLAAITPMAFLMSGNTAPIEPSPPLEVACYRATPHGVGAVAAIEIIGDVSACLTALCGRDVQVGALQLRRFERFDSGLVARLAPERAQLMPHGGTRIGSPTTARIGSMIHSPPAPNSIQLNSFLKRLIASKRLRLQRWRARQVHLL